MPKCKIGSEDAGTAEVFLILLALTIGIPLLLTIFFVVGLGLRGVHPTW